MAYVVIARLEDHPHPYVTVGELAQYWAVSRKQIYKHIENGTLTALRFGPRLLRIQTAEARRFELEARMIPLHEQERAARLQHITAAPAKAASSQPASRQRPAPARTRSRSSTGRH